jgi:dTDP-4-amino-4,6-dideoxygalactose transaminase
MCPKPPSFEMAAVRLADVDRSGLYSNFGPQERELRERFAERLCIKPSQVGTVANATLGLVGAVAVLGGSRWAVPVFTFAATPAAVLAAGAGVVFTDVGVDLVLDAEAVPVDGLMPVAPFGAPPDLSRWAASDRVVHDAAASLGNDMDLRGLPARQAVVFSLHATKVLGAGEGGIVVFGDEADAARFRAWTNFGFAGSREAQLTGVNAKMSEMQACYVHAALDGWNWERAEWLEAREGVERMVQAVGVELFRGGNGINPYAVAFFPDAATTMRVESTLLRHGVGTRRWWSMGCHRMAAYAHLANNSFPVADDIASRTLGLPLYRGLSDKDLKAVRVALEGALAHG